MQKCILRSPNYKNLPGGTIAPVHPPQGHAFGPRYILTALSPEVFPPTPILIENPV